MSPELTALVRRHVDAENAQNLEATLATLHPQRRFEDHATGQVWHGRDGAAAHYRQWWTTFDVTVKRDPGQIAAWTGGDGYLGEATWRGHHVGPLLGIAPTGRPPELPQARNTAFRSPLDIVSRIQVKEPSFIARPPLMKAASASRDSAPPTLMRFTPTDSI
ncbi:MAG: hypothetical protein EBY18_07820 [Alphaproteobacteria bacterium]|nr:hypothetical protein [Alphaproteobacteria bacterium]